MSKNLLLLVTLGLATTTAVHAQNLKESALRSRAASLRQEAEAKPGSPAARAAAVEEVFALCELASTGDTALAQRRRKLVEELTKDEDLAPLSRYKVAAFSANVDVSANRSLDPDQKLAAYADVAWQLARQYPENPQSYVSLLRIARDGDDAQAVKIAAQVLASPAPAEVKGSARLVLERMQLIGRPLKKLVEPEMKLSEKASFCVFAWSTTQSSTWSSARFLQSNLPSDTRVLAICLDGDIPEARAAAAAQNLPFEFVYPEGGVTGALSERLKLDAPRVYLTDTQGRIKTLSGLNYLAKTLRQKKGKGATK